MVSPAEGTGMDNPAYRRHMIFRSEEACAADNGLIRGTFKIAALIWALDNSGYIGFFVSGIFAKKLSSNHEKTFIRPFKNINSLR
jgi:hypothetical protein